MDRSLPRLILWLFRKRFRQSADFLLGDLAEEYAGGGQSRAWLYRQAIGILLWPGSRPYTFFYPQRSSLMRFLSTLGNDLKYAARTLRQNPGFTAVAVLIIALAIGVNTGIFTILDGAALRPLQAPDAANLVSVYQNTRGTGPRNVHGAASLFSNEEYRAYRDSNRTFSGLAAYEPFLMVTLGGEQPRMLYGQLASCNYFDVLRQPAALGRTFVSSDCAKPGEGDVVVLSQELWRSTFAADPAIAGKKILLNRRPFTVVGVAPAGFQGTEAVASAFWVPFTMQPVLEPQYGAFTTTTSWLALLGRRRPGVSLAQARADLSVIAGRIDQLTPGRVTTLSVQTATTLGMPEARKIVVTVGTLVLAAVGMVLLIACANIANLLLARAAGRSREIAIRLSVGASRARLIRQLLTESVLIALLGGTLGSLAAVWSFQAIATFIVTHLPFDTPELVFHIGPDLRVFAYALGLTFATGILFGLAPALHASRADLNSALKDGGSVAGNPGSGLLRQILVGGQLAVSMMLLISAGLLLRGLYLAQTIDPGFAMQNITALSIDDLRAQGYDQNRAAALKHRLIDQLRALPGVDSVAQAAVTPLSDSHIGRGFDMEVNAVTPEYFSMLEIPIVRGRNFTADDLRTAAKTGIVTESAVLRFWPDQDPLGKPLLIDGKPSGYVVVGVARDAQVARLGQSRKPYLYLPVAPDDETRSQIMVHTSAALSLDKAIRAVAHTLDPGLVVNVSRLEDNLEIWRTPSRIVASLAGSLGALALLLASIGLYGVVAYGLSRRSREIGIRMTLGATGREVTRLILWQAMRPVLIGAAAGIAGCAAVSRALSAMLFGASAHDPLVFAAVPVILLLVALLASYIPARRAVKVDPMIALRYE